MNRILYIFLITIALLNSSFSHAANTNAPPRSAPPAAPPAVGGNLIRAENPCGQNEAWFYGKTVPNSWKVWFTHPFEGDKSPYEVLLLAQTLKMAAKNEENKAFSEYWIARSLMQIKMYHQAHSIFTNLISATDYPATRGVRVAALECLNKLQKVNAALMMPKSAGDTLLSWQLQNIPKNYLNTFYEAILRYARNKISTEGPDTNINAEMRILQDSGPFGNVLTATIASRKGNDNEVLAATEKYFKNSSIPDNLKQYNDIMHLLQGQSYYDLRKYKDAIKAFDGVSNGSNYFVQSLLGKTWSHLLLQEYSEAVGAAANFIYGPLRKTFAPEANIVIAIAMNETCNYAEALETLKFFKKSYSSTHRWLYSWQQKQTARPQNMYTSLVDYMKKRQKIPDRIGNEWIRLPQFISNQEEINLISDEQALLKSFQSQVMSRANTKKDKNWKTAAQTIVSMVQSYLPNLKPKESKLLKNINDEVTARTSYLVKVLADTLDNAQKIEVEVYNALGEKMIVEQAMANQQKIERNRKDDKKKVIDVKVWDWGKLPNKYDEENEDQVEIWLDEIGFLRTDLTNRCKQ